MQCFWTSPGIFRRISLRKRNPANPDFFERRRLHVGRLSFLPLGGIGGKGTLFIETESLLNQRNSSALITMSVDREDSSVVRLQLRPRHTSSKVYNIWTRACIGHYPNIECYCQCKVGTRVGGCWAHAVPRWT
ncbi:hypothetical protein TNCV_397861 [Trichonephila clavipes]|nr:hypothetical protein TNCV_397861 [Trichonephila clavipes]